MDTGRNEEVLFGVLGDWEATLETNKSLLLYMRTYKDSLNESHVDPSVPNAGP